MGGEATRWLVAGPEFLDLGLGQLDRCGPAQAKDHLNGAQGQGLVIQEGEAKHKCKQP